MQECSSISSTAHTVFVGSYIFSTSGFYIWHSYGGSGIPLYSTGILIGLSTRKVFGTSSGQVFETTIVTQ